MEAGSGTGAARCAHTHTDALGSVRGISDGSGALIGTMRYTPFGVLEHATGTLAAMGYTGEQQDSLVYLRARYYHPALGRFLTQDSIVPDVLNGQDWNGYAYVRNNYKIEKYVVRRMLQKRLCSILPG